MRRFGLRQEIEKTRGTRDNRGRTATTAAALAPTPTPTELPRYRLRGPAGAPLVVVLGGISADCEVDEKADGSPGWWSWCVGPDKPIDTRIFQVLSFDFLPSSQPSVAPALPPVASAEVPEAPTWAVPPTLTQPENVISTFDQARALASLLSHLGFQRINFFVGASYGGMVALAFATLFPSRLGELVVLSAAHRSSPYSVGFRTLQRKIVQKFSPYDQAQGLSLARALAMLTYRTDVELNQRFDGPLLNATDADSFPIWSYLEHQGESYARKVDPNRYLLLSRSIDHHDIEPERLLNPMTLITFRQDLLVPLEYCQDLARRSRGKTDLLPLDSIFGHDAFLKEQKLLTPILTQILSGSSSKSLSHKGGTSMPFNDHGQGRPANFQTIAARTGIGTDRNHGAVIPPLYLSSNYTFESFGQKRDYDYTRSGNPTRDQLAEALAGLEGGAGAVVTSSGMAALHLITHLLPRGAHVLATHDCYGGTARLLNALEEKGTLRVSYVDFASTEELDRALLKGADLALVETPSNPLLRVVDLHAIGLKCRAQRGRCSRHGHRTLFAVDNTFLSPALQRPLAWGADLVVHSTTKYLNGHSDVVGGAVVAADPELLGQLHWWSNCLGLTGAPFDAFMTLRGVRTLVPRLKLQVENTRHIVELLTQHPAVTRVYYPGLKTHPGHEIAKKQQTDFGAMVTFELAGGLNQVKDFLGSLRHFSLAESLGGVESLVAHPATMTHAAMPEAARERAGINDQLIRLSVGLEDAEDLVTDLRKALDRVRSPSKATARKAIAIQL
ncbi:MAG: O-succinylhomoserine (thiol)-lyase [Bdellovibrio sp.]|nr:MAG: O-succinylhomoserine (thiol)-lyase [Bdellovibrio sp.]